MTQKPQPANLQSLLRVSQQARHVSTDMAAYRTDDKAWVYQVTYPEGSADFLTRFSFAEEKSLPGHPGAKLRAILAFKGGFCVFSRCSLVSVERPAGF